MAISIYPLGEGPRATRNKRRTLESSDEWASLKAKMMDGIKPFEEVVVTFTAQDKAKMRIKGPQRVFRDMAKEFIRKAGLSYTVDAYKSEGNDVVLVRNEPVLTKQPPLPKEIIEAGRDFVQAVRSPHRKKRRA
jgi:hypothetical protein